MNYLEVGGKEKKGVVIQSEIKKIMEKYGNVTPTLLVNEAQDKKHPLHKCFEWDDSEAARRYRLGQATQMILAQRFVVELKEKEQDKEHVHYVRRLLPKYDEEHNFCDRAEALSNVDTRKILIDRKIGVLRSWCNSVVDIEELAVTRKKILAII